MSEAYRQSGVNIEAGYEAVARMKSHVARTARTGLMGGIGGFGGLFDLSALNVKKPVLVSGTDSVGSKLKIAFELNKHDTMGQDVVAMCVNDIICQGAEPLFFLDYIGINAVVPEMVEEIVKGVSDGCVMSGCALVGGETAELPDLYKKGEYDLVGFALGVVEKSEVITGENIKEGDTIVGIASSGVHSNGFSLVRKIVRDFHQELGGQRIGETLLTPTKIYAKPVMHALQQVKIKGMAHITGGGFIENIPRIFPKDQGLSAMINKGTWEVHDIFQYLQKHGGINEMEMYNVFNMGIGMALVVDPSEVKTLVGALESQGEKAYIIGSVTKHDQEIVIE